jgi:hypothetical protein
MRLDDYERAVRDALHPDAAVLDPGIGVIREAVRRWAHLQLVSLCPLTTRLLALDGRCASEIDRYLAAGGRPCSIHLWSQAFLVRLTRHDDPFVADVARFELACVAPQTADAAHPEPWSTWIDPGSFVADLLIGEDPRSREPARCWLRLRRHDGRWHLERCVGPDAAPASV